jgi:predicted HNH restriction endonuclease
MTISLNLTESQFDYITKLEVSATDQNDVLEQEEGERTLKLHQSIERKPELISAFKLCTFYLRDDTGPSVRRLSSVTTSAPVAQMRPGEQTKSSDLRAVCSNCRRMLHRASPMLTVERLREMIKQSK